jgi:putative membrane-bound dehydrogenase-like protein
MTPPAARLSLILLLALCAGCGEGEAIPAPTAEQKPNAEENSAKEQNSQLVVAPQARYQEPAWPYEPKIEAASAEGQEAIAHFRVPSGMELQLWAAEPDLANPVAFDVAADGRVYVAETFRQETEGVPDNRSHPEFLEEDLRTVTVEQRGENYLKNNPALLQEWTDQEERIRVLWDEDGDGRAETSRVFARGFSDLLDGTGAGVLAVDSDVYFTCIPKLWKLTDLNRDGVAEDGVALHHGYGPRIAFRGHDMHGLVIGPDQKLYFSVGDRGYHVLSPEGVMLSDPGRGGVFRCKLDGTELEVFARGLRNPQELAFDNYGNLFTVDNNCDAGDRARLIYLVEGGDSGWSMNFQYLNDRGPWMPEGWWQPRDQVEDQAAFLNPPLANITSGPSGFAHYPGVGLPEKYANSFFVCDFTGGSGSSGIRRFTLEPDGAGWKMNHQEEFWWGMLTTDLCFGPDGALWALDWVEGWTGAGKGRIYRGIFDETKTDVARETAALLNESFEGRDLEELGAYLGHPDRRVRLKAQFALVAQGGGEILRRTALAEDEALARIASVLGAAWLPYAQGTLRRVHAIWGLIQLRQVAELGILLDARDPELRAQAARAFGEAGDASQNARLMQLAGDPDGRVRYHATMSLSKVGKQDSVPAIKSMLAASANQDPWLRHAGAIALAAMNPQQLAGSKNDADAAIRMASVLAARHLRSADAALFLADSEPTIAVEAARVIWDKRIVDAYPALADLAPRAHELPQPLARRALAAANYLGRPQDAAAILAFMQHEGAEEKLREDCTEYVREWPAPKEFDRILNESFSYPADRAREWFDGQDLPFLTRKELDAIERGEKVFRENLKATCMKCHAVGGSAITALPNEAGPDLSNVGLRLTEEQIRANILNPAETIAHGFEKFDAAGNLVKESAMTPNLGTVLTGAELDDLVAFLADQKRVRRILVHVESRGFEHDVARAGDDGLSLVEKSWQQWDAADPRFEVMVDRGNGWCNPDALKELDAVFFYTTGELDLSEEQKSAFMQWIRAGGGFAGSHCADDTFYQWADYGAMIGGYFDGHPWHEEIGVKVEQPGHVAARHFPRAGFRIVDEIYQHRDPFSRDRCTVLLSMDTATTDMKKDGIHRKDGDFAISWTRREGDGRVFYTGFGHREDVWQSDNFRQHLVEGTLWAAE